MTIADGQGRYRPLSWYARWLVARLNDLALVLWVCRVSAFSAFLGWALLVLVPQVRDLFIDVPGGSGWRHDLAIFGHASIVAGSVFFFWALPVFFVARSAVDDDRWIYPYIRSVEHRGIAIKLARRRFGPLVEGVPLFLGFLCFGSVQAGLSLIAADLYDSATVTAANDAKFQVQAHLVATTVAAGVFIVLANWRGKVYDATLGRWNAPLTEWEPVTTRSQRQTGGNKALERIRFWSFLALAFYVGFIFVAPDARLGLERATLLPVVLGAWVPIMGWLARKSYVVRLPLVLLVVLTIFGLPAVLGDDHAVRLLPSTKTQSAKGEIAPGQQWYLHEALIEWAKQNDCQLPHPDVANLRQIGSATAEKAGTKARPCPSPVIVAAAGGASRAAFITAGAIGTLLDATCEKPPVEERLGCAERPIFARRMFAISGVSGGSLGGAIVGAAFGAAAEKQRLSKSGQHFAPPCDPDKSPGGDLWFRSTAPRTWRDCLEAAVAGDFLSTTAMGLVIRDPVPFVRGLIGDDRAGLLEQSWNSRFDTVVANKGGAYFKRPFASFGPRPDDWRPLLVFNGTSALTGRRIVTSHLKSNHSLQTGDTAREFRIFQDSYDIRELFEKPFQTKTPKCDRFVGDKDAADPDHPLKERDFSLATAATNSARFPLISPSGGIMCKVKSAGLFSNIWRFFFGGDTELVDYVVDGGYFENFGATTAMNVARALETFGLKPIVLLISNNPMASATAESMLADACPPLLPDIADDSWLGKIARPAGALYQSRDARGSYAIRDLVWSMRTPESRGIGCKAAVGGEGRQVYHVTVFGEVGDDGQSKSVSMSWWLSKPVQQFIDYQIPDVRENPVPLRQPTFGIMAGRLENIRNLFELCEAIGAAKPCREFFIGLPLTPKERQDYIDDKTIEWAEKLARERS